MHLLCVCSWLIQTQIVAMSNDFHIHRIGTIWEPHRVLHQTKYYSTSATFQRGAWCVSHHRHYLSSMYCCVCSWLILAQIVAMSDDAFGPLQPAVQCNDYTNSEPSYGVLIPYSPYRHHTQQHLPEDPSRH